MESGIGVEVPMPSRLLKESSRISENSAETSVPPAGAGANRTLSETCRAERGPSPV
jgi:hypothetical protein